eukprot:scaffold191522_cov15-Tisochrysis_lutea.AAC.1
MARGIRALNLGGGDPKSGYWPLGCDFHVWLHSPTAQPNQKPEEALVTARCSLLAARCSPLATYTFLLLVRACRYRLGAQPDRELRAPLRPFPWPPSPSAAHARKSSLAPLLSLSPLGFF